jgi:hypothetical protein
MSRLFTKPTSAKPATGHRVATTHTIHEKPRNMLSASTIAVWIKLNAICAHRKTHRHTSSSRKLPRKVATAAATTAAAATAAAAAAATTTAITDSPDLEDDCSRTSETPQP